MFHKTVERDEVNPSIDVVKKIAGLLGTTVGYLLSETEQENLLKDPAMLKRLNEIEDKKEFAADMMEIYHAATFEAAEQALENFEKKWNHKYAYAVRSWRNNWVELTQFFDYPLEIRKIVYTTNVIESLNRGIRKYTKPKSVFPHDQAALKAVYLAITNIEKKWTLPIRDWGMILQQFLIKFEDRCRI